MAKIYAVKNGRVPGVYNTWEECKKQVDGFSGAEYKSFKSEKEAIEFAFGNMIFIPSVEDSAKHTVNTNIVVDIYVDGSFQFGNYSYGYVVVKGDDVLHKSNGKGSSEEAKTMRNVAGELAGAMRAVRWAKDNGYKCHIYHDYEGVGKWAQGSWKCKNKFTKAYKEYMDKYADVITGFTHVYGHTGNKFNEMADRLADSAFCA